MAKRKKEDSFFESFISALLLVGLFKVVYDLVHPKVDRLEEAKPGIHGLPNRQRLFQAFIDNSGNEKYRLELEKLDSVLRTKAINLAIRAQLSPELNGKWFQRFENDTITGELKLDQIRILFYQENLELYHLLTVFLKKDEKTDLFHKTQARKYIAEIKRRKNL